MAILRPIFLPTSATNPMVVAKKRNQSMLDQDFYRRAQQEEEEQQQQSSKIASPEFQQQPMSGQYIQQAMERMKGRTPAPSLNPGARAVVPDTSKISNGAFKGYYDQLTSIGNLGQERVATAQALAAARRLAQLNAVGNAGPTAPQPPGGGGGSANQGRFNGSGNVGAWINQAAGILAQSGITLSEQDKQWVATMIQHESGGNPNAINNWDSNAKAGIPSKGLMQTIDPTFNSNKLAGYNDIYNPIHNILAGVRYAVRRYGSIANVPGIRNLRSGRGYVGY